MTQRRRTIFDESPADFQPTPDELKAQQEAATAGGTDQAWGSGIGTALGGAAGLGLAALLAPATGGLSLGAALPAITAGAGIGGSLGSAIGGSIGNATSSHDNDIVNRDELERQKKIAELQMRQQALNALENSV